MGTDDELLRRLAEAVETQNEISRKLLWEAQQARKYSEVMRHTLVSPILDDVSAFASDRQLGLRETMTRLTRNGESFARFGDGELRTMLRSEYKLSFQKNSPALRQALRGCLQEAAPGLLIGFPYVHRDLHWSAVWADVWGQAKPLFERLGTVGNSHVSRPVFFEQFGEEGVELWRQVWSGQTVTIVSGKGSRFEPLDELFGSRRGELQYVHSAAVNAFEDLDRVLESLSSDTSDVVLTALGPAGTVLAAALAQQGRRALDIGHLSSSYQAALRGGTWPENLIIRR